MQLLRDNLTLWTSSDGNDGEAPKEDKPEEEAQAPASEAVAPAEEKPEESKPVEADS